MILYARHVRLGALQVSAVIDEASLCLQPVLSTALQTAMMQTYGNIWREIVLIKPPWSVRDALQCFKKYVTKFLIRCFA